MGDAVSIFDAMSYRLAVFSEQLHTLFENEQNLEYVLH